MPLRVRATEQREHAMLVFYQVQALVWLQTEKEYSEKWKEERCLK
jgi:hypothetical protein